MSSLIPKNQKVYHNDPKFSDRQILANSADPDQTALTVCHSICIFSLLDTLLYGKVTLFKFKGDYSLNFLVFFFTVICTTV